MIAEAKAYKGSAVQVVPVSSSFRPPKHVVILGAGPAGLGAAYELARHQTPCTLVDKNKRVGGLARTLEFKGFRFDIGPHRFFTKEERVNQLWREVLGSEFVPVQRLTRIYYGQRFFHYPLKPLDALVGLGIARSIMAFGSYLYARMAYRRREARSFEEWITFHFGWQLYDAFFKTYTEKVWGIPCSKIAAQWAAQRIRGLNLWRAAKSAFLGNRDQVRTLTDQFHYPRLGAGMLYEKMADRVRSAGSHVFLERTVEEIHVSGNRVTGIRCADGQSLEVEPDGYLLSSIPITEFVTKLSVRPPPEVLAAAQRLKYRDHITVNLTYFGPRPFPDNWIYVHSEKVRTARITNYANFTRDMTPDADAHGLTVEYFCFRDDDLWKMRDDLLIQLAVDELKSIGVIRAENVRDGFVVREKDAYPAYYVGYESHLETVRNYVGSLVNVQMIGRGGLFKYGNQDHAVLTGILAARNLVGEEHDLWFVHEESEYLEEKNRDSR
ncbi:MAG: FAD-dependent oxidoreductase [Verrucomicrobia bacterium]|nr:FAD-dependent oxidoreductase [Verrucomicrobiota bacterium]